MTSDCSESETVGVKVKMLAAQSCLTLCDRMDYSPPGWGVCVGIEPVSPAMQADSVRVTETVGNHELNPFHL